MFLEQDVSGRCYLENIVQAPPVIGGSRNGINWIFSKGHGSNY